MRERQGAFSILCDLLDPAIARFPDNRKGKNTVYTLREITLSAFSVFLTQSPSFLSHQRTMQSAKGNNNARTLFAIETIPTDNQIRNVLDAVPSESLHEVFWETFALLRQKEEVEKFRSFAGQLLLCLDGTQFFRSEALSCPFCSSVEHKNGTVSHFHSALTPVIVAPGNPRVIALAPEIIKPQDGKDKQDCESQAAKRWIHRWAARYKELGITVLGDDLFSRQPTCTQLIDNGLNFILVCKPSSHPWLSDWIAHCDAHKDLHERRKQVWNGKKHLTYITRWANHVPLKDDKDALWVNWAELIIENEQGEQTFHNSWVTTHVLSEENVEELIRAGRCRWKIENENNNTLKTKGYHLEHNFGHGKKELSNFLLTLNLLAFLFHTVLDLLDLRYRLIRRTLVRRDTFFHDLRALTRYMCFSSWTAMLLFMLQGLELEDPGGEFPPL